MVQIQPGEFLMGSEEAEDERPTRRVRFESAFLLGVYPVTQALYKVIVGRLPLSRFNGQDRNPVDSVSWFDAVRFCNLLSAADSLEALLRDRIRRDRGGPAEIRVTACRPRLNGNMRAGQAQPDSSVSATMSLVSASSPGTTRIRSRRPNLSGKSKPTPSTSTICTGMSGNGAGIDTTSTSRPHPGPAKWSSTQRGPAKGQQRVLRGGCFRTDANQVRCATRNPYDPDQGLYYFGFRLARSLDT